MNICTGTLARAMGSIHDEIVFDDSISCPLCELLEKICTLEKKIEELEEKIEGLESERLFNREGALRIWNERASYYQKKYLDKKGIK